jgi:hypothetical protein
MDGKRGMIDIAEKRRERAREARFFYAITRDFWEWTPEWIPEWIPEWMAEWMAKWVAKWISE